MSEETTQMKLVADRMYKLTNDLVMEGNKPFAIAAVHVMIALQIYKTSLSEEEYHLMVDSISASRDKIKSLDDVAQDPFLRSLH